MNAAYTADMPAAAAQDLSAPFKSAAEVLWHQPQMPGKHWDTSIMVKVTHLKLQPAFAHVPLVHSAMHLMQSSLQHQKQAGPCCESFLWNPSVFLSLHVANCFASAGALSCSSMVQRQGDSLREHASQL